jgi:predicted ester cyclase
MLGAPGRRRAARPTRRLCRLPGRVLHPEDDLFFAGEQGVWRGSWRATQRGAWQGIAASRREVTWTVIIIGRFVGGKLVEDWVEYDRLGLFQQLGAIPVGG